MCVSVVHGIFIDIKNALILSHHQLNSGEFKPCFCEQSLRDVDLFQQSKGNCEIVAQMTNYQGHENLLQILKSSINNLNNIINLVLM